MREEGGTESSRKGGFGEWSVGEVWGGLNRDQRSRKFQIKDAVVVFEAFSRSAEVFLRLVVSRGDRSHFIFLDLDQLRWLQSVLEVAESNRWRFPKWCSCEGPRRDIRVQSFFGKGGAALNVAEHCRNGKQVFVNIPAASSSGGWSPLLKTLISLLEVGPIPKEMSQEKASSRSFADIVKGPSFSFQGRCSQDSSGITVEAEGVENRLRFLERCICFRFSNKSPEAINWSNFRVWLQRNWGVDANARVSCLDDDLWLIEYRSKSEVDRIVSLKRDLYGSSKVLFDRWSKWAGSQMW
ncbi:hypothetical protein LINPERPRIM_LOCUS15897 [Linum perenne]